MKKKILITGGSGFVGRNFIEYIESKYDSIWEDRPEFSEKVRLSGDGVLQALCFKVKGEDYELYAPKSRELNVLDEEMVAYFLAVGHFDTVLHFAVYTDAVDKSKNPEKMLEYNLKSFMNFYKYRHLYGRMFYSGSGAEFNKRKDIVKAEEAVLESLPEHEDIASQIEKGEIINGIPSDQYGLMKYTIGQLINSSENIVNLRIFGLFGKYEYKTRFITEMCHRSLVRRPLEVRQNVYFDYLYIGDFCQMLMMMILKDELKYKSYNMVSGKKISLLELCDIVNSAAVEYRERMLERTDLQEELRDNLMRLVKQPVTVEREGLNNEYTASNERFMEEFPLYEYTEIEIAIEELYDYYARVQYEIMLSERDMENPV